MLTFLKVEDCDPAASGDSLDMYQDSVLEGLKYLLGRSDDQERQLAKLSIEGTQRDRQIEDLYSHSVRMAEAIHQQAEHINHLEARLNRLAETEHIKQLEARLNGLAEGLLLVARKPQSAPGKSSFMAWR